MTSQMVYLMVNIILLYKSCKHFKKKVKRYSIIEEDVKCHFNEILKANVFSRPLLERNYMYARIRSD